MNASAYVILYHDEGRWKQHRPFFCREDALRELSDLALRFPSREFEMVTGDGRLPTAEVAPIPDDAYELTE